MACKVSVLLFFATAMAIGHTVISESETTTKVQKRDEEKVVVVAMDSNVTPRKTDSEMDMHPGLKDSTVDGNSDFFSLALQFGTDKVQEDGNQAGHHYHNAYQKYLIPLRYSKIKFLEIGLGCDMHYGPGKSAQLWKELFEHPLTEIWEAEANVECASKWNESMNNRILIGDQGDEATLRNWITATGGEFDIIIDDGGHTFNQQLLSLKVLFDGALRAGGIYFMEDLVSNVLPGYNDAADTPVEKIRDWNEVLMLAENPSKSKLKFHEIANLQSIECFRGMCAFHKCPESTTGAQCP